MELINYNNMSDEELELQSTKLSEVRMNRFERKLKQVAKDIEIEKIEREKQGVAIKQINDTLKVTCIDRFKYTELDEEMKNRVFHFTGKIGSCEYILFFSYYKSGILNSVKKEFGVNKHKLASIKDLKESVIRRGVVEPIVVTQELLIVSGHQRVRACKEMGLLNIPCRITYYPDYDEKFNRTKDDMILEDLICTNIMQRGVGNVNPMKMARCIQELERIKGIRKGSAGKGFLEQDNLTPNVSQSNLADELNISRQQLREEYSKIAKENQGNRNDLNFPSMLTESE